MMNHIALHGRLTKDPDYSETSTGIMKASFSIAVDRDYKAKNEETRKVDFFNCIAWRGTADFVNKWFSKGQEVVIGGRMEMNTWTDDDGKKRTYPQVVISSIDFAGSKRQSDAGTQAASPAVPEVQQSEFYELEDDDSDLPF